MNSKAITILYSLTICFSMTYVVLDMKMSFIHNILTICLYISFFLVLFQWRRKFKGFNYPKIFKWFVAFFLIYSLVIFNYLTVGRQFPLSDMLGCPGSIIQFISETLILLCLLLFLPLLEEQQKNTGFLFKSYIYLNILSLLYIRSNVSWYDLGSYALMASCTASGVGMLTIAFRNRLFQRESINVIVTILIFISCIMVWSYCNKRGPILYFLLILLFYFFSKKPDRLPHKILYLSFFIIFIILIQDTVFALLQTFSPDLYERFRDSLVSGDTSGRLGEEDSGYALAYKQIIENPWTGTYFRLTTTIPIWSGMYPHNFFLESMMTFGLAGTIPFLYFIFYAIKRCFRYLSQETINSVMNIRIMFSILFLNSFLTMMSTGTPLLNRTFWVSLGAVLYFSNRLKNSNVK